MTELVSVVIPAKDEAENLKILISEIDIALADYAFEIIVVDDGSSDETLDMMKALAKTQKGLRCISHAKACGQSAAVRTGVLNAKGQIVVTTDADGQNDPAYMPNLIKALQKGGEMTGMAAGQRLKRTDSPFKRLASRFANWLRGSLLKDNTRDSGCGLKAVRTNVFLRLPYFDSWHRFMAALVIREGYNVVHVDVIDRSRRHGQSKYGVFDRALTGALDLIGVWWLRRRRKSVPQATEVR